MPNRLTLRLTPAAVLLVLMAGCGEDTESPTSPGAGTPEAAPAIATLASSLSFRQVSAGGGHTCGLTSDSLAYCWGTNSLGELGDGTNTQRLTPVAVAGGLRFVQITAGSAHTCAVTKTNLAYCWGSNSDGQLGDGTQNNSRSTPTAVGGGRRFRQIRAGFLYTCALNLNDAAYCWGDNELGQLGTGHSQTPNPTLVAGGLHFRQVITGASHTCAVTRDDRAYCWGDNTLGQLGDGTRTHHSTPVAVAGRLSFQHVVPGSGYYFFSNDPFTDDAYTCGVTTDSKAYCWGSLQHQALTPVNLSSGHRFSFIALSEGYPCGVALSHAVFCWSDRETLAQLPSSVQFSSVTAFALGQHFCGVTTDNRGYCWGANNAGQLGDGTTTNRLAPVAVAGAM